ncbi:MAG: polymer-forming cytoskeletal protein [Sphaerobacteraceae bacterium]|nr:MAG: polymer-forming cytoskeletal protein [Sphaerobacteraceae bacterium]
MSYQPSAPGTETPGSQAAANEPLSLIDRNSSIEGTFTTTRDVRVEGMVRGKIVCQGLLYVAESADIDATVEAASVTVAGKLTGDVTCRGRLQITGTGRVSATVSTEALVIDEGAFYEGDLNMKSSSATVSGGSSVLGGSSDDESPSVLRRLAGSDDSESGASTDPPRDPSSN